MQGYKELRGGAAWVDLERGKISMTGDDRARLLHAMTTNHIQGLTPGQGCYAYFLSAQGRILADVNVFCREDSLLLDTEPELRAKVMEHLDKFIIADDVTLEDSTPRMATIGLAGPGAGEVLSKMGASDPEAEFDNAGWRDNILARVDFTGARAYYIFYPPRERDELVKEIEAAGAVAADMEALRVVRLEHGVPRYGEDISERYLVQEANQAKALNFQKGCYLGQEIVERVRARGQVHRKLMRLEIDIEKAPEAGAKLTAGDSAAAEITSAGFSPALGKVVALAYVRTEFANPGCALQLGDAAARVG